MLLFLSNSQFFTGIYTIYRVHYKIADISGALNQKDTMGVVEDRIKTKCCSAILLFLLTSCGQIGFSEIPSSQINETSIQPSPHTYKLAYKLKGETECEVTFKVLMDGSNFHELHFEGEVDTLIKMDWYENELGFGIDPLDCLTKDFKFSYRLYE